jgi:hypothetical protein
MLTAVDSHRPVGTCGEAIHRTAARCCTILEALREQHCCAVCVILCNRNTNLWLAGSSGFKGSVVQRYGCRCFALPLQLQLQFLRRLAIGLCLCATVSCCVGYSQYYYVVHQFDPKRMWQFSTCDPDSWCLALPFRCLGSHCYSC